MTKKENNQKKTKRTEEESEQSFIYQEMNSLDFKKCFKNLMNNYKTKKKIKNEK